MDGTVDNSPLTSVETDGQAETSASNELVVRRAKSEPRGHRSRKHKVPKRSNLLKMEASPKVD
jgi:hypothetical protein